MITINNNYLDKDIIFSLLKQNRDVLNKYLVKRIGLFGSYVREEQQPESDLDFVVELEKPSFDNFMNLADFLENLFGKKVDLLTPLGLSPYMRPYIEKEIKWYETR